MSLHLIGETEKITRRK